MNPHLSHEPQPTIAVIGAGRLGTVLARALRAAGFEVHGPFGRDAHVPETDVALLTVPDAAIAEASAVVRARARFVGHLSGATPLDAVDFSMHPLQTFTGAEGPEIFVGIGCAVAGRTDAATALAVQLAEALGARPISVDDANRAGYHAAASIASNLVLAVLDAAEQVAATAGITADDARMLLAPLVRQSVENWAAAGAAETLTGPIARGDEVTVQRQRAAVHARTPELAALFDELCATTRGLAQRRGATAPTERVA